MLKSDLITARERIADIKNFCQNHDAMNADDCPASPSAFIACKFCGLGAARALSPVEPDRSIRIGHMERALQNASKTLYNKEMVSLNDGHDGMSIKGCHLAILSVYDHAISDAD